MCIPVSLSEVCPVDVAHVARREEFRVEAEGGMEGMGRLSATG